MQQKDCLEELSLDWRTVLKETLRNRMGGCELNSVVSGQDKWQALVNTVMDFGFYRILRIYEAEPRLILQGGLCFMELVGCFLAYLLPHSGFPGIPCFKIFLSDLKVLFSMHVHQFFSQFNKSNLMIKIFLFLCVTVKPDQSH